MNITLNVCRFMQRISLVVRNESCLWESHLSVVAELSCWTNQPPAWIPTLAGSLGI